MSAFHGVSSNGYPNLFIQSAAQAGATTNYVHVLDVASEHIAGIIAQAHQRFSPSKSVVVEPTVAAQDEWGMRIVYGAAFFCPAVVCDAGVLKS